MKILIAPAFIGLAVFEFIASQEGIGYLIKLSSGLRDTPLMMVAITALRISDLVVYGLIRLSEHHLILRENVGRHRRYKPQLMRGLVGERGNHMARIDRRLFVTLAGATGTAGAVGISAPWIARTATPTRLTLSWLPLGTFSFTFVAKAMGFWEKRGLDVTIDRGFGSGRVCVPVDQGQYDFGILDLAVMMNCAGRGLDLVAVAGIWPISPIGIFSLKEYDIRQPKDLEGQTVGFDVGSGDFQLWPAFVKATGIDDRKVKKVMLDSGVLNAALIDGQVKAIGNFFPSLAPTLWAHGLEMNSILYADYGIKTFNLSVACKRLTIEKRPEICRNFVEGLMEGLKYVYLNPEKSVAVHLESIREFKGGSITNEKVIEYGQAAGTALGMTPAFKQHGLGYMEPGLIEQTAQSVVTYMGVTTLPKTESMFTNSFVGTVRLTDAEWKRTEERSRKYLPEHT